MSIFNKNLVLEKMNNTISKFSYSTLVRDDTWANGSYTDDPENNCTVNNVKELRIHGNKLYVISNGSAKIFRIDLLTSIINVYGCVVNQGIGHQHFFKFQNGNTFNLFNRNN